MSSKCFIAAKRRKLRHFLSKLLDMIGNLFSLTYSDRRGEKQVEQRLYIELLRKSAGLAAFGLIRSILIMPSKTAREVRN